MHRERSHTNSTTDLIHPHICCSICEACRQAGDGLTYQRCGDVDDVSEFLKAHSRDRELRHEKEPKQIRRERDSKVFRCVLREWLRKKNARIIHQQIDGPKVLDGSSHDPLSRFQEADIAIH